MSWKTPSPICHDNSHWVYHGIPPIEGMMFHTWHQLGNWLVILVRLGMGMDMNGWIMERRGRNEPLCIGWRQSGCDCYDSIEGMTGEATRWNMVQPILTGWVGWFRCNPHIFLQLEWECICCQVLLRSDPWPQNWSSSISRSQRLCCCGRFPRPKQCLGKLSIFMMSPVCKWSSSIVIRLWSPLTKSCWIYTNIV